MRKHALGGGEWVGAAYLALVLGALIGGLAGANAWHEILAAFVVALVLAFGFGRLVAAVDWPRRPHRDGSEHDG